jgi:hypothetical protein
VEIRQEGAHVFKLRDGKVVRLEIFANRRKALESVGERRRFSPAGVESTLIPPAES